MNDPVRAPQPPGSRERVDAARNRHLLLGVARTLIDEVGVGKVTMDGLATRAGVGKGTVFRRFGSRAGVFQALLDEEEGVLRRAVLSPEPPLGSSAPPLGRLITYGHCRIRLLCDFHHIARAALADGPSGPVACDPSFSVGHIGMLLEQLRPPVERLDVLAMHMTAALERPPLLRMHTSDGTPVDVEQVQADLIRGWTDLVVRTCDS